MSKITFEPNASGTGVFTIASPNSNTDTTLTLPDASGTLLTSGSQLGVAGIDSSATGTAITIDSSNRVLMPNQPAFRANMFQPITASGTIIYTQAMHNIGSHYNTSNGKFTAPVDGVYQFDFNVLMSAGSSTSYLRVVFKINGNTSTTYSDSLTGGAAGAFTNYNYHAIQLSQSFYLAANDTVEVHNDSPGGTYTAGSFGSFSGYLVG